MAASHALSQASWLTLQGVGLGASLGHLPWPATQIGADRTPVTAASQHTSSSETLVKNLKYFNHLSVFSKLSSDEHIFSLHWL